MESHNGKAGATAFLRRAAPVLACAVLALALPAHLSGAGAAPEMSLRKSDQKTVTIPVEGMVCISCAATVKRTLKALSGVSRVEVDLEKRAAEVTYAADKLSTDRIIAAVNKLGYKAGLPKEAE